MSLFQPIRNPITSVSVPGLNTVARGKMEDLNSETKKFSDIKQETMNILVYSDIFQYPLTKQEIYERGKITINKLELCLNKLVDDRAIFLIDGFYTLHSDRKIIENRIKRNKLAEKSMITATFMTKIVANFPFVRGVFLSGSMSKNCMDEDGDIDFFIITKPKRLWVSHLFFSLFKKTFLLNNKKYLCYNYFIDSEHLEIPERSIYTAIEIKTLIPMYGFLYYEILQQQNEWTNAFFPNHPKFSNIDVFKSQTVIQKVLEFCLDNKIGDWIDKSFLLWSTKRRQKRLEPKFFKNKEYYTNLQSHIAKAHITDTYPNIIKEYSQKIKKYSYSKS